MELIWAPRKSVAPAGAHSGSPNNWDNYTFPHYREFDENWNYTKVPLNQSNDLETMIDAVSVTPGGITTGLGKNVVQKKVVDMATNATVKKGVKEAIKAVHTEN